MTTPNSPSPPPSTNPPPSTSPPPPSTSAVPANPNPLYPTPGRRRISLAELANDAAFNPHRQDLLQELEEFFAAVRLVVPICAAWISGSYLTDKDDPADVDVVLVFNEDDINGLTDPAHRRLVTRPGLQRLATVRNLRVDPFALIWRARPDPAAITPPDSRYLMNRGYWDDFWLRMRTVPKGATPTRACALPRRGYVEVILDGYS